MTTKGRKTKAKSPRLLPNVVMASFRLLLSGH